MMLNEAAEIDAHAKYEERLDIVLIHSDNDSYLSNYGVGFHMYICVCNAVTEREIRYCAQLGCSLDDLRERLGVCTNCGKCKHAAKQILREERSANGESSRMQPA